jgi:ABC-type multidrug transport system fused ATPase/permease subunit
MITPGGSSIGPGGAMKSFGKTEEGKAFDPHVTRRLFKLLGPYKKKMFFATLLMFVTTGMNLLWPNLMRIAIDFNIANGDYVGLARTALLLLGAFIVLFAAMRTQRYLLSYVGQHMLSSLRARLFRHLQRLHLGYHDVTSTGRTVSRVVNDVQVINELLSQGLVRVIGDLLLLGGVIVIMMTMSPRLALYSFMVIPLMVLASYLFSRKARSAYRETRQTVASVVGGLAEDISGMREIQAFTQERNQRARFEDVNVSNRESHIRALSLSFIFIPAVEFLGILSVAIVLFFGGRLVISGALTIGILVAFISYVTRFFQPIRELSQLYSTLQRAMAAGEQVFKLLDTEPQIRDEPDAIDLHAPAGRIEFADVSLSYRPDFQVLHGVNFSVEPGNMVALVGPTGAGKSSIINLIARFYEVSGGAVRIDDYDVRSVTQQSLRRHMAIVAQEPVLFPLTIKDNIRFGRPDATEEEVRAAAVKANADAFIRSMPNGYDTLVQEGAVNLSVGQRQLIAIARAILVDPRILLMDEATSNVDTVTESLIQSALDRLFMERTSVVVAHRLSTVRHAACIYVIDNGRIVESGRHEELVSRGGLYADLTEKQFVSLDGRG